MMVIGRLRERKFAIDLLVSSVGALLDRRL